MKFIIIFLLQVIEIKGEDLKKALVVPESMFKPGDIIRVNRNKLGTLINYYHVGVYIGNNQIAHIHNNKKNNANNSLLKINKLYAQITGWQEFLGEQPKSGYK